MADDHDDHSFPWVDDCVCRADDSIHDVGGFPPSKSLPRPAPKPLNSLGEIACMIIGLPLVIMLALGILSIIAHLAGTKV
jgi:hypothetical protein